MTNTIPQHIAIVMDGNGRWAEQQGLTREAGHKAGRSCVKPLVEYCAEQGVQALSLFALSTENLKRPQLELKSLMHLFSDSLKRYTEELHQNNVRLSIVGDHAFMPALLRRQFRKVEKLTANNTGLTLSLAINYSGRWDILQAMQKAAASGDLSEEAFKQHLSFASLPELDLFVRTSGEYRISNFMLWQLAYAELYFTDTLWPDFTPEHLAEAMASFSMRKRRFGLTQAQLEETIC